MHTTNFKPQFGLTLLAALAVTALSCSSSGTGPNAAGAKDRSADEAAIRRLVAENMAASNKHDAPGVAATYAQDADLMAFGGGLIFGRSSIRQHEETFFSKEPSVRVSTNVLSVRFLTSDVAVAECSTVHRFTNRQTLERATLVIVRRDGHWSIAAVRVLPQQEQADMFSSDLPPTSEQ